MAAVAQPITLGFVSTAVGKSAVRRRLESHLRAAVVDVDAVLCGLQRTAEALTRTGASPRGNQAWPRLLHIMQRLPRSEVMDLWLEALDNSLVTLRNISAQGPRILLCGIMYHSKRRSEFYSPFNLPAFIRLQAREKLNVGRVVMFIDDIYDMYARLSGDDELYERFDTLEEELGRVHESEGVKRGDLPFDDCVLLSCEVQTSQLVRLLHWRQLEITAAERTARSIGVDYLLWAVKQGVVAISPWLQGAPTPRAYVSHPISGPRRQFAVSGSWPAIVEECNAVQGELAKNGVVAVMPTGIDEYRLAKELRPQGAATRRRVRSPRLTDRWPLMPGDLLYEQPSGSGAPGYEALLTPFVLDGTTLRTVDVSAEQLNVLDGPLRSLERQIEFQVAARDHTIVVHTDHVIVFRPFFDDPHVSRGVLAEVVHWSELARLEPTRRIAFLHRLVDVKAVLRADPVRDDAKRIMQKLAAQKLGIPYVDAADVIEWQRSGRRKADMLDSGAETPGERRATSRGVDSARAEAPSALLWAKLALFNEQILAVPKEQVGLWIVKDQQPWEGTLRQVAEFLSGKPLPEDAFALGFREIPAGVFE